MDTDTALGRQVISTVTEIFTSMVMMDVECQASSCPEIGSNISGIIGIGGDVKGLVAVHMPQDVALAVTEGFLGIALDTIDNDVKDAVGEIVNMIAGGVKEHFASLAVGCELAIPSAIVGTSYKTGCLAGSENATIPFSCAAGLFSVEVKYVLTSKNG